MAERKRDARGRYVATGGRKRRRPREPRPDDPKVIVSEAGCRRLVRYGRHWWACEYMSYGSLDWYTSGIYYQPDAAALGGMLKWVMADG